MAIAMLSHCLTMFDRKEQKPKRNQIACFIIFIITEGSWAPAKYRELQRGKQAIMMISVSVYFLSRVMSMITWKKYSAPVIVIVLFFEGEHFREPNISVSHASELNEKFTM